MNKLVTTVTLALTATTVLAFPGPAFASDQDAHFRVSPHRCTKGVALLKRIEVAGVRQGAGIFGSWEGVAEETSMTVKNVPPGGGPAQVTGLITCRISDWFGTKEVEHGNETIECFIRPDGRQPTCWI